MLSICGRIEESAKNLHTQQFLGWLYLGVDLGSKTRKDF